MIPCLFLDEDQDYYLNDDDFDRLSPLTNRTVAELLAFDVAPADASLHIELSKDEATQYSTLPYPILQTRDAFFSTDALINARKKGYRSLAVGSESESTCLPLGAAYSRLFPGDDWLGKAAVNLSIESVLRAGRVQNTDFETSYGLIPSTVISLVMARPPDSDPHSIFKACFFGPPNQYRNLIELGDCMRNTPTSKSAYGEEALSIGIVRYIYSKVTTNNCNQDTLALLVLLSNVIVQELRLSKKICYSTHLIDGTMPFRMIDGRQVIESLGPSTTTYRSTTDLTSLYPDERIISTSAHAHPRFASLRSVPGLRDAARRTSTSRKCHRGYKELNFSKKEV